MVKFGQLIIRKIIKIVATKCQILRLKCKKKNDFGLQRSPRLPSWIKGGLLLREGQGYGKGGEGRGRGRRGGKGRGGTEEEEKGENVVGEGREWGGRGGEGRRGEGTPV